MLYSLTHYGKVFVTLHNALGRHPFWREWIWKKRLDFLSTSDNFNFFAANQQTIEDFKHIIDEKNWGKLILSRASVNPEELDIVSKKEFNREESLEKIGLRGKEQIILSVGQFIDRKGRWVLLEAAQKLIKKYPKVGFVWLMPQLPDEADLNKIESFGLGNSFQAVKSSTVGDERIDILKFFRIADIFALPSLLEGLPISLLEAMGLGICSVSTNINAIPETLKNMETGIMVEPGDSGELFGAFDKLLGDTNLREKLARQGKEFVLKNFDERFWTSVAIKNYEKNLESRTAE